LDTANCGRENSPKRHPGWADAPPCDCPASARREIERRALDLRAVSPGQRTGWERYPATDSTMRVLRYLLWDCPRWAGHVAPSAEAIVRATKIGLRTVERAVAVLDRHGLVIRHRRPRRLPKPVVSGGRVHTIQTGMNASNAYSFPQPGAAPIRPRQTGGATNPHRISGNPTGNTVSRRDSRGRFVPAALADWVARARLQRAREGGADAVDAAHAAPERPTGPPAPAPVGDPAGGPQGGACPVPTGAGTGRRRRRR
jgi:hypothetical protein